MLRLVLLSSALLLVACSRTPDEPTARPAPSARAAAPTPTPASSTPSVQIRWSDPPGWQRRPGSNAMRKFEYTVARAPGDPEDGELVVTSFGLGQGGDIDANIDRWVRQFSPDGGSQAKRDQHKVGEFPVELVEIAGTYNPMAMPGQPAPHPHPKSRLLGAIVSTPSTRWFFKLVGPDATVQKARSDFSAMIDSIKPG